MILKLEVFRKSSHHFLEKCAISVKKCSFCLNTIEILYLQSQLLFFENIFSRFFVYFAGKLAILLFEHLDISTWHNLHQG